MVEQQNRSEVLAERIRAGHKKEKEKFFGKGRTLSALLYKLEWLFDSPAIQKMRQDVETLDGSTSTKK